MPVSFDIAFPSDVDEKRIGCRISIEALQDHFGAHADGMSAFLANRSTIEAKAAQKISKGQFEQDGTILLRTSDFP